jgi:multiple sugar transport system permease protein
MPPTPGNASTSLAGELMAQRSALPRTRSFGISPTRRREVIEGYVFLLPWIVGYVAFSGGPILASAFLSLTKYNVLLPPTFIGLKNYVYALTQDDLFIPAILKTFYYAILVVPPAICLSLAIAILLNQKLLGTAFWRTMFFLPTLTPVVAAALLWRWMLNPDVGLVNYLLAMVGIQGPGWLTSVEWSVPSLALIGLWTSVGGAQMIIFLAGLQNLPQELIEAAQIDGAGAWTRFRHVTLPMVSPTIFFNLVLGIIFALRTFDVAFVATNGGPARATWFISIHIYQNAFVSFDMGYASALSWMFFLILLAATFLQIRLSGRWVFYAGEKG